MAKDDKQQEAQALAKVFLALPDHVRFEIETMIQSDKITTAEDLRDTALYLFRSILMGEIPFRMSNEIRGWCKDLLPIILATEKRANTTTINVNGSNMLINLIQQEEQQRVRQIIDQIDHMGERRQERPEMNGMPVPPMIAPEPKLASLVSIPPLPLGPPPLQEGVLSDNTIEWEIE